MKLTFRILAVSALSLASLSALAVTYNDAVGDLAVPGSPFDHIDITSVVVTNTATDVTFQINVNGNPIATNWGKYNIIMRSPNVGELDTSANGNGWGRPYNLNGGANKFLGGWADQTVNNSEFRSYVGASWGLNTMPTSVITASSISYTLDLSSINIAAGQTLVFDVVTTGGGGNDGAVDSLSNSSPQITDWGQASTVAGLNYTVTPVPEPASMIALGLGMAAMLRRRK